ncbi:hypothetical protein CEXT_598581 [Caerostris extrusa]|uniref:Uncharacterized protein n=1 Tax=Caerostris extrusa TaxID=172846 RepID=A0AAV4SQE4_CAEEX|nr:hypothetical protein CEXT_598581 [Caerostris extrusa]
MADEQPQLSRVMEFSYRAMASLPRIVCRGEREQESSFSRWPTINPNSRTLWNLVTGRWHQCRAAGKMRCKLEWEDFDLRCRARGRIGFQFLSFWDEKWPNHSGCNYRQIHFNLKQRLDEAEQEFQECISV